MRPLSDLEMIAVGAFSPLTGFMTQADYKGVVKDMHLASGAPWSLPVTLSASRDDAKRFEGKQIALTDEAGNALAVMDVEQAYEYDKQEEARLAYRTDEEAHPGVAAVYAQGEMLLGGPIKLFQRQQHTEFLEHRRDPKATRAAFAERGWKTIVGFQTRNPVHRAHEYIQKCALETVDGLLLHPLVGATKDDDIPAPVRMACYEALLAGYYPSNRVLLSVFPAAMRYAGPREAIFHALVRKNYGCSHFIVGRDHAGVGSYYGTYDAQQIFKEFAPGRARHHADVLREQLLLSRLRGHGHRQDLPPRRRRPRLALRHEGAPDALRGPDAADRVQPPRGRSDPDRLLPQQVKAASSR